TEVSPPGSDNETELGARVKAANDANADIFISIHANSSTSPLKYGHEDYYYQGAGKSSKDLARSVYDEILNQMKLKGNGVLTANFYVIKYTKMPAELTEMEYLSNPEGEKKLKDSNFQKNIALAITQGLANYFVNLKGKIPAARIPPKDKYYKQLPCEKIHK
ncbi:MAG: N-acetylmuramoyl-L-alanine amidase, partial [Armatimonadetes bacterium]|nr:N-acetylmuramoyl-L-alanine amidase [Armatimonadota bacterium]